MVKNNINDKLLAPRWEIPIELQACTDEKMNCM